MDLEQGQDLKVKEDTSSPVKTEEEGTKVSVSKKHQHGTSISTRITH